MVAFTEKTTCTFLVLPFTVAWEIAVAYPALGLLWVTVTIADALPDETLYPEVAANVLLRINCKYASSAPAVAATSAAFEAWTPYPESMKVTAMTAMVIPMTSMIPPMKKTMDKKA